MMGRAPGAEGVAIRLFGPPRILLGERDVTPGRRRALALVVILAVEGGPISRDHLVDLLWPEGDPAAARADLSRLISYLGRAVGPGILEADRRRIALRGGADRWIDAAALEALTSARDHRALASLVADLSPRPLEGLSLAAGVAFDDWLLGARERLGALLHRALGALMARAAEEGAFADALALAQRRLELDPLHEPTHQRAMALYAATGQRLKATLQYRRLRRALREEVGVDPSEATQALHRRIVAGAFSSAELRPEVQGPAGAPQAGGVAPPPSPLPPTGPLAREPAEGLVGREAELASLGGWLEEAVAGRGRVALILGEAGIGKTSLLKMFVDQALSAHPSLISVGAPCAAVVGDGEPYHPFLRVAAHLAGGGVGAQAPGSLRPEETRRLMRAREEVRAQLRARLPATLGAPWGAGLEIPGGAAPLGEALFAGLAAVANLRPLLLWLDDLQWADRASADLFLSLAATLEGAPVMLVAALRADPAALRQGAGMPGVVGELRRRGARAVSLEGGSPEEGRRFVDALIDREPNALGEGFRAQLARLTGGHPLFAAELLAELRRSGALARGADGRWRRPRPIRWESLPPRVEAVIDGRLGRLGPEAASLLQAAAVVGEAGDVAAVAACVGGDRDVASAGIDALVDVERLLIRGAGEGAWTFRHSLFRHAILRQLPRPLARSLHRALALHLQGAGQGDPARVAHHWREAGDPLAAARWRVIAGDAARTAGAAEVAAGLYEGAAEALEAHGDHAAAARTLMKLGLCHHDALRFEAAHRSYAAGMRLWRLAGAVGEGGAPAAEPLRVGWREPVAFDPREAGNFWVGGIIDQTHSGLFAQGPDVEIVPDLVIRWTVSPDGQVYRFHLDPRASWSDGRPVVAGDLVAAWRRVLWPPVSGAPLLYDVRGARGIAEGRLPPEALGARAEDPLTLVVEMEAPSPTFVHVLANPITFPVPAHALGEGGALSADPARALSNGAFQVESYQPGERLVLRRRPGWHRPFPGNVRAVEITLSPDADAQLALWEAGALDVFRLWQLPGPRRRAGRDRHRHAYRIAQQLSTIFAILHPSRPPLGDVRLRQALALALDKELLVAMSEAGEPLPARGGLIPPGLAGHQGDAGLPYDPDRARRLLAEAGHPGGAGLGPLVIVSGILRDHLAQQLAEQWRVELGWEVVIARPGEDAPPAHVTVGGWTADYPDPDSFARGLPLDVLGDACPRAHLAAADAARREADPAIRGALYAQMERALAAEARLIPLYYGVVSLLVQPRVLSYPMGPMRVRFWAQVRLGEGPAAGI